MTLLKSNASGKNYQPVICNICGDVDIHHEEKKRLNHEVHREHEEEKKSLNHEVHEGHEV